MATDFPIPVTDHIGFRSPSALTHPFMILRSVLGVVIPALLDWCCIGIACIAGILLYELYRPLNGRDAWLLCSEISLKYGAAFVILAQAHHLYTQRATLLQVGDTARVLKVSTYGVIHSLGWQLLHQGGDAAPAARLFLGIRDPPVGHTEVLLQQALRDWKFHTARQREWSCAGRPVRPDACSLICCTLLNWAKFRLDFSMRAALVIAVSSTATITT